MNVGIPGTGIGGLFYLISGIVLLLYELFLVILGKSSKTRIIFALRQARLIFLVIMGLVAVDGFLIFFFKRVVFVVSGESSNSITVGLLSVRPIVYGIFILFAVSLSTEILGWYFSRRQPIPSKNNR